MIDIKLLRKDPENFTRSLGRKRYDQSLLAKVLEVDGQWRTQLFQLDSLKAEKNKLSKEMPRISAAERLGLMARIKTVSDQISALEPQVQETEKALNELLIHIPNPPHESAPDGASEEDSQVIKVVGEPRHFDFTPKDHAELGEINGWIEISRAAKASGTRFNYLLRDAVLLQLALVRYALDTVIEHGFTPVVTPIMVREQAMFGTGFFPADRNEIYKIEGEDHFLIGTSEVALAAMLQDEIIPAEQLPLRYAGISTCLRKEAGSYGKDTKGIFRVHQFDKVEMFTFCLPEDSWKEHERILAIEEKIIGNLGLPYRVVNICTADLGAPAAKKYDIEVWLPGQNQYRELTSCSNCTDYQARRLAARAKVGAKTVVVHTLNGTATAIGRTLIAIMENYQQVDGSIATPSVLKPYLYCGPTP